MNHAKVAILGAGNGRDVRPPGHFSDLNCSVYEARSHAGGHASSFKTENGFIFDEGPHVSFTPHERIKAFLGSAA